MNVKSVRLVYRRDKKVQFIEYEGNSDGSGNNKKKQSLYRTRSNINTNDRSTLGYDRVCTSGMGL